MARLGSQAIAGYYPTPSRLLPSFASILAWAEPPGATVLLDPCASDGGAILTLRKLWRQAITPESDPTGVETRRRSPIRIVGCELEVERAAAFERAADPYLDEVIQADAFRLRPFSKGQTGAAVLYLNPPYDHDREHGRLEQRFLARFTRYLHAGRGVLFFVVPFGSLAASADFLSRHYLDLRAWRFPDPEFEAFGQVLVVGRRASRPLPAASLRERILAWAADGRALPVLPEVCSDPLRLEIPEEGFSLRFDLEELDLTAALDAYRPWEGPPLGLEASARGLLGARFETAVPPKPAHIALALSSGMFNGHRLEPNDPDHHPPLLAKGVFERDYVEVSRKVNAEGEHIGSVQVERPRLRLTVLRLDRYRFETLAPGTVPTGATDPADWNAADLIANYDRSLSALLARQFPALHDPADSAQALPLPTLARKPFAAQAHAIRAALKLLAVGRNPFLVAEVGTGKTTMALSIAAALSPDHHPATTEEFRRLGFERPLPVVRRTLAVCPPHLLDTWAEEARAVVPGARVQIVRRAADLEADAELYVLSRETAKLGHGIAGVEGRCPCCGSPVLDPARKNASRRLRCRAGRRRPANLPARLALNLAVLLAPHVDDEPLVTSLVGRSRAARLLGRRTPFDGERFRAFFESYLARVTALLRVALEAPAAAPRYLWALLEPVAGIARVHGLGDEVRAALGELPEVSASCTWGPADWLTWVRNRLADDGEGYVPEPLDHLLALLESLWELAEWHDEGICGEPLFGAVPRPRRYPLARLILRRYRRRFDLLLIDEGHEYGSAASAQTKAAHRLSGLPGVPTILLTGSLMGGYASSLFPTFWSLVPAFREEFRREDRGAFVDRYGYRKVLVRAEKWTDGRRGSHTDREVDRREVVGEAPGVMPTFLLRHLLPTAVLVHKEDLDVELPPIEENPVAVDVGEDDDAALLGEYRRLQGKLLARIRADRFDPDRAGRLLGALVELPSYLDRATDDLPPFEVRYPEACGGELIATGKSFPASWRTPKERWLAGELRSLLDRGEKVLVFLRHTGTGHLPRRLLEIVQEVTPRAAWLNAGKVPTAKRQAWIDRHVLGTDVEVLLVNPNAVRTGLNNLVSFSTGIWYELDWSATTYRQANGRLHRIGQTRPVEIEIPYYEKTAQEVALKLVAKKVSASLQVDGLDLQAALEAAGASEEETASVATAMSLGQAVYDVLTGEKRTSSEPDPAPPPAPGRLQ